MKNKLVLTIWDERQEKEQDDDDEEEWEEAESLVNENDADKEEMVFRKGDTEEIYKKGMLPEDVKAIQNALWIS